MGTAKNTQTSRPARRGLVLAFVVAASQSSPAEANWFGRVFTFHLGARPASTAPPARYAIDTGGAFILDRSGRGPLLKFSDSPEVWVLTTSRGPRGDVIFSDDLGRPLLRTTRLGGVTVFTHAHPEGSAAAEAGPSTPLRLSPMGPGQLFQRLAMASARASRAAGRPISFQALNADAGSSGVIADAALVASQAVVELSMRFHGRLILAHVARVDFENGRSAAVVVHDGVIDITVAPTVGRGGRPSSARILRALGAPI
jgi:hypothetical protein